MKQHRELSLWLVTLVGCSAAASVACGDDLCSGLPAPILVCGNSTQDINFTACGDGHTLKLRHGFTWADAVTNCDAFRLQ